MQDVGIWLRFLLCACATWRVSHMLASEDGPGDVFARLRRRLGQSPAGRMMDCFGCVSLWVAMPLALYAVQGWADRIVTWLALSGAAFLLESALPQPLVLQPAAARNREATEDDMLRQEPKRG